MKILRRSLMLCFLLPFTLFQFAQARTTNGEITVSGKVINSRGETLQGVSIRIKETKKGVNTDNNGHFQIKVERGQTLLFSLLGYENQSQTVEKEYYEITLQEISNTLGEVVVTALGVKKSKSKLGYAVQEVDGADLVKAREPNMISNLTGKVAGLVVKNNNDLLQEPSFVLRGRTPLIVIDGIPDQNADIYKINSDDIENMSILKGASASALYGSIGQNGAIMITTKRGSGKSFSVTVNSSTEIQNGFISIPKVQTTYGNGDFGRYSYVNGSGGGTEGGGWIWGPKLNETNPNTPSGFNETIQYNSPINPETGERIPIALISRGKDNIRNFFRTGIISSNNVSITSVGKEGNFRASISNIYQKGIVPNTHLNNISFNLAGNYNISEKLNFDSRLSFNKIISPNFPETGYGPTNYLYNLVLWTGTDVDVRDLRNYWVTGLEGYQQRHYNISYYNNPYFQAYEYLRTYDKSNIFGNFDLNYKVNAILSAKFRTGVNSYNLNRDYREPKSYIGYGNKSRGQFTNAQDQFFDIVNDLIFDISPEIHDNFKINSQLGASNYYRNQNYGTQITDGLSVPNKYNLSNSIGPITARNTLEERRTSSIYGVIDMNFYKSFFLTFTGRNDWVSTLPIQNNNFFYPSVTGSILLSELWKMPKAINYLKLRGGFSRVSSGLISNSENGTPYTYDYLPAYSPGVIRNGAQSLTFKEVFTQNILKPQTSDSWEIGLESKLIKNRLGFDITCYRVSDFNNIVEIPVATSSGYASQLVNGNTFLRTGLELVINGTAVQKENFNWNFLINLSTYRRYLKNIYDHQDRLGLVKKGERMDQLFNNEAFETSADGQIIYGTNGMPVPSAYAKFMGYSDPDWVYGFENTFRYKNFSLRILTDGRIGGTMFSTTNQKMWWGGQHPGTVNNFRDDAIKGNNTYVGNGVNVVSGEAVYNSYGEIISDNRTYQPNTIPVNYIAYMQTTSNYANTNYSYFSQTFLKVRELSLTYQVKSKWLEKAAIRNLNVSLVGRNLWLFSKLPNVDSDSGVDNLQTPSTRNYGVNINFKF